MKMVSWPRFRLIIKYQHLGRIFHISLKYTVHMVLNNSGRDETPSETARSFDSSDRFAETPNSLSNSDRLAEKISSINSSEKVAETVHSLSGSELQYPTVTIINSETGEKTVIVKDWTDEEERRLVRRVDFILIPLLF